MGADLKLKTRVVSMMALAMASAVAHAATSFSFQFDNRGSGEPPGTIGTPIVGTGSFISPVDLAPGEYNLGSLTGFAVIFAFAGATFTTADIATPIDNVVVDVTLLASGKEGLVFTGSRGGPLTGSLDLINSSNVDLSFEPYGGSLYFEGFGGPSNYLGTFLALGAVPEPATWATTVLGFGALAFACRRSRWSAAVAA